MTASLCTSNTQPQSKQRASWLCGDPPPCLGGSSHRWVPVNTHSTPVPSMNGRLWVAHHHNHKHNTMCLMPRILANMVTERWCQEFGSWDQISGIWRTTKRERETLLRRRCQIWWSSRRMATCEPRSVQDGARGTEERALTSSESKSTKHIANPMSISTRPSVQRWWLLPYQRWWRLPYTHADCTERASMVSIRTVVSVILNSRRRTSMETRCVR